MNKDVTNLIKDSASTMLNIAQMTQSRMKYLQDRNAEDKQKMIKYTLLSVAGIACLLTIGIVGLVEIEIASFSAPEKVRLLRYSFVMLIIFSTFAVANPTCMMLGDIFVGDDKMSDGV